MIKEITSTENKIYKQTKKLLNRSERNKTKLFIAEGQRIVEDAVSANVAEYIFVSDKAYLCFGQTCVEVVCKSKFFSGNYKCQKHKSEYNKC